ncbi:melanophilin [Syngnathus typhle]|uniref:melanophilin n=1 Tax=Syngnathus typhle TaxID=161592 RepID=UPI002A69B4C2|nr:melanophilin [Syngnathus typhle]XP_061143504.1 melanophilin [Syngnathus typhle]XP_061143505.1 melanophilin [Syngnathus typhle]XP_061143506.1 melanophilin [Syngnathus typhle]
MMGGVSVQELDLSKLTDDEAKHVWQVVRRDFDLRKKEEDRLGELKSKIEREDFKREMLAEWADLTQSHCIRCLKTFKFLLKNKRQCLDCRLHVCGSCSRYNKKEHGWLCDVCHMARVLKIGTLEWYHKNVRMRFKRFGSAKVMRSLFKRLGEENSCDDDDDDDDAKHHQYDTQSNPEVHTLGLEDSCMNATDSQRCVNQMKKTRRRLTVDPIVFGLDSGPGSQQLLKDQGKFVDVGSDLCLTPQQDDPVYSDNGTFPSRCTSRLSYSSYGSGSGGAPQRGYFLGPCDDDDDSEEDDDLTRSYPMYRAHLRPREHVSHESLNYPKQPPQISELNRRMSAIESLLSRMQEAELRDDEAPQARDSASPLCEWEDMDLNMEEHQLRQKLMAMAGDISDHSLSSDEEESTRSLSSQETSAEKKFSRSVVVPTWNPLTSSQKAEHSSESLEHKWQEEGSKSSFKGSTALLFELEDKIAQAAANVHDAQTQVSFIENRIAALNPGGMPLEKRQKSGVLLRTRRLSQYFPTTNGNETGLMRRRLSLV